MTLALGSVPQLPNKEHAPYNSQARMRELAGHTVLLWDGLGQERLPNHSLQGSSDHHPKPIWDGGPWWELGLCGIVWGLILSDCYKHRASHGGEKDLGPRWCFPGA